MGWTEFEKRLMEINGNWFLNHDDHRNWEYIAKLLHEELPHYSKADIDTVIEHAKISLLPPISKVRIVRWLQSNLPQQEKGPEPPPLLDERQ